MKTEYKALVISGGGYLGAFAIGVEIVHKEVYDLIVGTSTGSLAAIMIAQGEHEAGREMYLSSTNKSIYDKSPFDKNGKIRKGLAIRNHFLKKKSLASTNKLQVTIRKLYSEQTHKRLKRRTEIVVTVSNLTKGKVEYKSSFDYDWKEFTKWVWISTLAYPYTETVMVNGSEYGDGGYAVPLPVEYADEKADSIKCIVLSEKGWYENFENENVIEGTLSVLEMLLYMNLQSNIRAAEHYKKKDGKKVDLVFMYDKPRLKPMVFMPEETYRVYMQGVKKGAQ